MVCRTTIALWHGFIGQPTAEKCGAAEPARYKSGSVAPGPTKGSDRL